MGLVQTVLVVILGAAACAVAAAAANPATLNPDGVAYALVAEHVAEGRFGLAVTGYWGPLLPWTAAPLVAWAQLSPELAVRIVVAMSTAVFAGGAALWLSACGLGPGVTVTGTLLCAATGVAWSQFAVTPDLFLAGFTAGGAALLLRAFERPRMRRFAAAGALFGCAYLSKGVGLPASVLAIAAVGHLEWWSGRTSRRESIRRSAQTAGALLAVSLPWILVISIDHGSPVFSTAGAFAHAAVGPGDVDRFWPTFRTFHVPEAGRVTSWEDPSALEPLSWSPFASLGHAWHQVRVAFVNCVRIVGFLRDFDAIGLLAALTALAAVAARKRYATELWRWSGAVVVALCALYVPVFADSDRYFWVAFPFLLSGAFGMASRIANDHLVERWLGRAVVAASVVVVLLPSRIEGHILDGPDRPGLARAFSPPEDARWNSALAAADAIRTEDLRGPVCGDTREAMIAAFLLRRPCHGEMTKPAPADLLASGAEVFVLRDGGPAHQAVRTDPAFRQVPLAHPARVVVYAARVGGKTR
ncbi:MAG: hypothetical protein HMLKMBBP_00685 [Planctomycetes bacterium]|nr:hypothetical protein [Planctomycetota bacterium]